MNKGNLKLKYYMRGLGIGIVITTVILSIAMSTRSKDTMSNDEIIQAAEKLGMKMVSDKEQNISKLEEDIVVKNDKNVADDQEENTKLENETQDENGTGINSDTNINSDTDSNGESDEQISSDRNSDVTSSDAVANTSESINEADGANEQSMVSFEIVKGMTSREAAELLYQHGVVENVREFDNYLIENGHSINIMIGNYTINKDASFYEIAEMITSR